MTKEELENLEQENQKIQERIDAANRIKTEIKFNRTNLNVLKKFAKDPELIHVYGKGHDSISHISNVMSSLFEVPLNDETLRMSLLLKDDNSHYDFADEKLATIKFIAHLLENRIAMLEEEFAQI